jgi:hypothetical protein
MPIYQSFLQRYGYCQKKCTFAAPIKKVLFNTFRNFQRYPFDRGGFPEMRNTKNE